MGWGGQGDGVQGQPVGPESHSGADISLDWSVQCDRRGVWRDVDGCQVLFVAQAWSFPKPAHRF